MKKASLFIIPVMILLLSIGIVSGQDTALTETVTVVDDLGREIMVPMPLTSVVTLAPSLTEMIAEFDAMDLLAGCDYYSDYPAEAADAAKVTNYDMSVNYEAVAAAEPQIVFAAEINSMAQIKDIEDLGLTVFYMKNPVDFEDLCRSAALMGRVLGKDDKAAEITADIESRVAAVIEKTAAASEIPLVFYEMDATDPVKPWTAGKGTFISEIIALAGGENLGDSLEGEWVQIGLEALLASDPDVILLGDAAYGNTPDVVAARTAWDGITAVREGRMIPIDDNLVSRPGPRLVDGLEQVAHLLHPELFE